MDDITKVLVGAFAGFLAADAYGASVALSQRWSFRRRMTIALPLFDNVVLKGGEAESGGRRRK
jgi:hypothetical protein